MKKKILEFSMIMLCMFSFFGYMLNKDIILLVLGVIPLLLIVVQQKDIKIYSKSIIWIVCYAIIVMSYTYSIYKPSTLYYIIYFGILMLCKLILEKNCEWAELFLKVLTLFCGIHLFFSLVNLVNSNIIRNINQIFMNGQQLQNFDIWIKLGAKIGIHSDPSMMAYIAAIAIGIAFSKIATKENKKIWILYLCISVISLLITTKRGLILAVLVAIAFTSLARGNINKKISNILKLLIGISMVYIIIQESNIFNGIFNRFDNLDSNNYLSGRTELYEKELAKIKENIFVGNGAFTTNKFLNGYDGHNIYIQMLLEYGIIGTLIFCFMFLNNIIIVLNLLKNEQYINANLYFCLYVQILFLVYGISGNPLYNFYMFNIYVMTSALILVESQKIYNIKNQNIEEGKNEQKNNNIV